MSRSRRIWLFFWTALKTFFGLLGASATAMAAAVLFDLIDVNAKLPHPRPAIAIMIVAAFARGAWEIRPKTTASCRVPGRETYVEVQIRDLFSRRVILLNRQSAYVIPMTRLLDCDMDQTIAADSVLGGLIKRFFGGDWRGFKTKVDEAIKKRTDIVSDGRVGDYLSYPIGTVVTVDHEIRILGMRRKMKFFLLCSSDIVDGHAKSEISQVLDAVVELFTFLKYRGRYMGRVRMPVIGTGHGRIEAPVPDVVRELVRQFIASCSDSRYLEKLTIVIHPSRHRQHPVNMEMMQGFMRESCQFPGIPQTVLRKGDERPVQLIENNNQPQAEVPEDEDAEPRSTFDPPH
jgi:hypothetical protein